MTRGALKSPEAEKRERAMLARITEATSWHRCWHCYAAPCRCPEGEGLGRVPAEGPALEMAKARRLKHDGEQQPVHREQPVKKRARGKR